MFLYPLFKNNMEVSLFFYFLVCGVCVRVRVLTQNLPEQRDRASPSAGSPESTPAAASRSLQKRPRGSEVRVQGETDTVEVARQDRRGWEVTG